MNISSMKKPSTKRTGNISPGVFDYGILLRHLTAEGLIFCTGGHGGFTLPGHQVLTRSLYHSPPHLNKGEKIYQKAHGLR